MESGEGQEDNEHATTRPRENRLSREVGVISTFCRGTPDRQTTSMN